MNRKVRIDPLVYPLWAFLLLAVPIKVLFGWMGAALFHEMGHIAAQKLLGGKPGNILIGPTGALIEGEDLGTYKNILCVLAGPAAGAVPMIFVRCFPEFAICAILLTVYNLIPLYPLDGGRLLYLIAEKGYGMRFVAKAAEQIVIICLVCVSFRHRTALPALPFIPYLREKFLAKRRNSGYNRATIEMR